jgi:hypothetical protein
VRTDEERKWDERPRGEVEGNGQIRLVVLWTGQQANDELFLFPRRIKKGNNRWGTTMEN